MRSVPSCELKPLNTRSTHTSLRITTISKTIRSALTPHTYLPVQATRARQPTEFPCTAQAYTNLAQRNRDRSFNRDSSAAVLTIQVLISMAKGRDSSLGGGLTIAILVLISLAATALAARDLAEKNDYQFPQVPSAIAVSGGSHRLVHFVFAKGHQHYRFNGTSWVQFNATAKLYDVTTKRDVGDHFFLAEKDAQGGQATWESLPSKGVPFSSVTCKPVASAVVDSDSIPWVLLETTQAHGSKQYLGEVVLVQRYRTEGGLAPTSKQAALGATKKSRYTAFYSFYVSTSQH